jgi:HK97 family phage prohead protease
VEGSFKTIWISQDDKIKAIIGKLKTDPNGATKVQSFLFDKIKWSLEEAKKWIEEHKKSVGVLLGDNYEINLSTGEEKEMIPIKKFYEMELKDFNDEERSFEAVASTEAVDRDGDIIRANGWKIKNYIKNPVVLWGHFSDMLPIAKATKIKIDGKNLMFKPQFVPKEINPFADQVYQMYKAGYLKSFSVRFDPIKWEELPVREGERKRGREYTEQELLEISAVNIPANPQAMVSRDYRDFIVKSFIADNIDSINDPVLKEKLLKGELDLDEIEKLRKEIIELKGRIALLEGIDADIEDLKTKEAKTLIERLKGGITILDEIRSK